MKTLEQIKNEEAINHGWENYSQIVSALEGGVISENSFDDYMIDVDKKISENSKKEKLMQLLELCIEKEIHFENNPQLFLVSVWDKEFEFNFQSNYDGINKDFEFSMCVKIDDLITKVKNYNP